ncbi:MAG: sulfur carrier protein ThiS adenylyltransferase ThiF [Oscillospiraceae bacterium]|nr:sulfur carrier protein ThiS adenylyltransferase ThiF [Oscillospiraceae bacterium]
MNYDASWERAITARNIPGIQNKLTSGRIAVAGLGGLGSNVAVMLARIGVGNLLLVDFDRVELSNLNRQYYDTTHLGQLKTDALKSQLDKINPFVRTETRAVKITPDNAADVFRGWPIVCEAFDRAEYKAILVNALLEQGGTRIVAVSGLAGYDSSNAIQTRRVFDNLYVCGDFKPPPREGIGLMAPRVSVCAGHQANMAVRLLLGIGEA